MSDGEKLLTMDEAAAHFRVSRRGFQDILKRVPVCHIQAGRKKLFDEQAIAVITEALRQRPIEMPIGSRRGVRSAEQLVNRALSRALKDGR